MFVIGNLVSARWATGGEKPLERRFIAGDPDEIVGTARIYL
jgi:hypothetical protein